MKRVSEVELKIGCVLLFTLFFYSCQPLGDLTRVTDLRCEYLENPLGIDECSPRLSWIMKSKTKGSIQTAYRIMAATKEELLQNETPDLWDSGKIESDQSVQIEYGGKPLESRMTVYWKVQIWDQNGKTTGWSPVARWEMGFLHESDWQATWIGTPGKLPSDEWNLSSPLFRKELNIQKQVKKARAYITGLGYYELYINGEKVGDHVLSPNQTNYDRRQVEKWSESRVGNMTTSVLYETFDITNSLQQGENALGVILGNGWYIQADRPLDLSLWYDTPRFLAQIEIEFEDGSRQIVNSDANWKTSAGPILYNGLHSGEIYDARMEQKEWNKTGFNDEKWFRTQAVRPPTGKLKAQVSPPDRVTRTIRPVAVTEPEKGVYRFDMGEMISGWARLKISGAEGTTIKLRFIEELGPTYGQTDTYVLKGEGIEIWEPRFTWHAFRYVEVSGSPVALTVENLEGRVVNTDVQTEGSFECSDTLLNRILKNYQSTQLGNLHGGIPSDCPHRERRGYTGDGQVSAKAAIYSFNMAQFYSKWLNDIRDSQNHKTGYVPNTSPYQDGGGGTAWGAASVIIPWYMYLYYSDIRILKHYYEGMKHWIEYMNDELGDQGILVNQGLGEWVPPDAVEIPADFVNTCYYFHCCRLMEKISGVLKNTADAEYFGKLASNVQDNINAVWFDAKTSNYSIGRQGANIIPLSFGIAEKNNADAILKNLTENLTDNKIHFDTGILATPLLLEILTELGRSDLAYTLMVQRDFPGFGYMIEKGATTIWETWQGDMSHSHPMFGSVCSWFYQYLGGISPDAENPGFKHSRIKPFPIRNLDYVNCSYSSMYGEIESHWIFKNEDYFLNVVIPANTNATVYVLAENEKNVTEGGKPVSKNPNIRFLKMEGQNAVFEVGSGQYRFLSKGAKKMLIKPVLPSPVIRLSNEMGMVNDSVKVDIISGVAGAKIYYTSDGSEPDSTSSFFSGPFYLSGPAVVKAKTYVNGYKPSFTKEKIINFVDPKVNGITFNYYEGVWTKLPDLSKITSAKSGTVFEFGLDKINPEKDEFAVKFEGKISIEKAGDYEFFINSNDGSRLYIDNTLVVDHDGLHGADWEKSGRIVLKAGTHPIQLNYFQAGGGMFLRVQYAGPDKEKQDIPAKVLFQN